jgi:hypothetical protein
VTKASFAVLPIVKELRAFAAALLGGPATDVEEAEQ